MKKILLPALGLSLLFAACKKDDDSSSASAKDRITGKWNLTSQIVKYTSSLGSSSFNTVDSLSSCVKDDLLVFNSDGTLVNDEGASKCRTSDPQTTSEGTWSLINNDTQVRVVGTSGSTDTGTIQELSGSTLKLYAKRVSGSGSQQITSEVTATYAKK